MKTGPTPRKSRSAAPPHNGNGQHEAPSERASTGPSGALVQFAADRAHDAADALHAQVKDRIDRMHHAVGEVRLEAAWQHVQPALVGAVGFVRQYPMRAAMILGLLGGAYWLTRVDEQEAS